MYKSERQMKCDSGTSVQEKLLHVLYDTMPGRMLLRPLISPAFSKLGGYLLNTRLSAVAVSPFVRSYGIDLSECEKRHFSSYNAFFTRRLLPDARPVDCEPEALISPCDARLSVYPITQEGRFRVKRTPYTVCELLRSEALARRYEGGLLWLFRLSVEDYHRYIYPDDARKSVNRRIRGVFHTVNPIANDCGPIYKENTREYCVLDTAQFGPVVMMEVGAMLVGKIENRHPQAARVRRGEEKGNFAFGGSTILLLTQKGRAVPEKQILENTRRGQETCVRQGERVGAKYGEECRKV